MAISDPIGEFLKERPYTICLISLGILTFHPQIVFFYSMVGYLVKKFKFGGKDFFPLFSKVLGGSINLQNWFEENFYHFA